MTMKAVAMSGAARAGLAACAFVFGALAANGDVAVFPNADGSGDLASAAAWGGRGARFGRRRGAEDRECPIHELGGPRVLLYLLDEALHHRSFGESQHAGQAHRPFEQRSSPLPRRHPRLQ